MFQIYTLAFICMYVCDKFRVQCVQLKFVAQSDTVYDQKY